MVLWQADAVGDIVGGCTDSTDGVADLGLTVIDWRWVAGKTFGDENVTIDAGGAEVLVWRVFSTVFDVLK